MKPLNLTIYLFLFFQTTTKAQVVQGYSIGTGPIFYESSTSYSSPDFPLAILHNLDDTDREYSNYNNRFSENYPTADFARNFGQVYASLYFDKGFQLFYQTGGSQGYFDEQELVVSKQISFVDIGLFLSRSRLRFIPQIDNPTAFPDSEIQFEFFKRDLYTSSQGVHIGAMFGKNSRFWFRPKVLVGYGRPGPEPDLAKYSWNDGNSNSRAAIEYSSSTNFGLTVIPDLRLGINLFKAGARDIGLDMGVKALWQHQSYVLSEQTRKDFTDNPLLVREFNQSGEFIRSMVYFGVYWGAPFNKSLKGKTPIKSTIRNQGNNQNPSVGRYLDWVTDVKRALQFPKRKAQPE